MQSDGNFVVYSLSTGQGIWNTDTVGSGATRMVMEADGSLNLYDANGIIVWSSAWYSSSVAGSKAMITNSGAFGVYFGSTWTWDSSLTS